MKSKIPRILSVGLALVLVLSFSLVMAVPAAAAAAPTVSSILPITGPLAGGTAVTITGTGFDFPDTFATTVTFGGVAATSVSVTAGTTITAITPAGTAGAKDVVVRNPDLQSGTLPGGFTYVAAPTVTTIAPAIGPTAGGTAVTITGTGFVATPTVIIGGTLATSVVFVSATSITATTPVGTAGAKDVVVRNPDTQFDTKVNGFLYTPLATPTVSGIVLATGSVAGGTAVTITGTGFVNGATVTIGGASATSVTWVSATSIAAVTPAGTAGPKPVVVTNPDTQFSIQVVNFTYVPLLTVTAITPTFGALAGGTSVTITGTGFLTGATVTIGGVPATGVTVGSATSITATTPVGTAGAKNVVVTNPDAKVGTLAGGFYYSDLAAPTVASILPIKGPLAGGTAVTITGTGFLTGATVTIGGTPATSVTWVSATSIAAVTPAGTVGAKPVVVTNPDTQFSVEVVNFTYEIVVVPGFDINVAVQDIWDEVTNIEAKLDMHGHFYTFVDDWFGTIEGYVQVINWADITAIKDELANTTYGLEAIKNAIGTGGGGVAKANDTDVPIVRNSQTAGVIIPVDTEAFWGQLTVESTGTGYHIDVWDGDGWATVVGNGQRVQSISVSGFGLRLYNGTRSDITVDYVFVYHSAP